MRSAIRLRPFLAALALFVAGCAQPRPAVFVAPPAVDHPPREPEFDVEHYALDLELFPAERRLEGACTVRLFALERPLDVLAFDLLGLDVRDVVDDRGHSLAFEHSGATLEFRPLIPLAPRSSATFTIRYGGTPRAGMWFVREKNGAPTQVYTQGECEDSRAWFPCFDAPSERATSELRVVMPSAWRSLAAGEFVDREELDGARAAERWRMSTPHPAYLTTLVAGEFATAWETWDGASLQYWGAPEYESWLEPTFRSTPQVLDVFSDLTGLRYPFPKYAQSCVDNFLFGGMENITATTLTDAALQDELGRRDYDASDLIAHEAAHQWFGDLVTCADWSHVWLNEGFATYFTQLYREVAQGRDTFRAAVRDMQESYVAADVGPQRRPTVWSKYRAPMDLFSGGHAYPGGASRLHLLRFVLGDVAFFRGIERYVADNRGRSVTTDDLRRALELESGMDLRPFFTQWFYRAGYPEFVVAWDWDSRRHTVSIEVEQVQKPLNGTPSVFVTPVDIEIRDSNGPRVTRVTVDQRRQRFEFPATTRPTWVVFDKYGWIPKRIAARRSTAEWLALAAYDDDVNGRRDALAALGDVLAESVDDTLRWQIVEVVLERLADAEPAVRAAAARAFTRVYTKPDHAIARALVRVVSEDPVASVRVAALECLSRWDTREQFADVALQQFDARFSYATMGAAAKLLALADPARAVAWLSERMTLESPHDVLKASLLRALATIPGKVVDDQLLTFALDTSSHANAREAAVRELASRASRLPAAREAFLEILRSASAYRLQNAAIDALGEVGDPRSRAALMEFYAATTEPRQQRAVEAALAKSVR